MASTQTRMRQRLMRRLLRRMALEVDPERARMTVLADELCVNLHTVLRWIKVGHTTRNRAMQLHRRFGADLADIAVLTGTTRE
jgi:hypothetical protein